MPKVQNYKRQTVQKSVMPRQELPKPPEMPLEPGKQDKICQAIFVGGLVFTVLTLVLSSYLIGTGVMSALAKEPVDWIALVLNLVSAVLLGFALRGLVWMSFAGTAMLAAYLKAFHAQEKISNLALKNRKFLPMSTAWASQGLMAMMANRQQWKEMIVMGTNEWEAAKKKDQNLAPLCSYLGMAHQVQNDPHTAILWNERAIELFEKGMAAMSKVDANSKVPNREFVDSLFMQYASAYANLASNYFAVNNFGKAKKNFGLALEQLERVKDNPQKAMLVRGINEHMARLKHW